LNLAGRPKISNILSSQKHKNCLLGKADLVKFAATLKKAEYRFKVTKRNENERKQR
jgi:hypothetical protein